MIRPRRGRALSATAGALHVSLTIDAPLLGHVLQLCARVLPE